MFRSNQLSPSTEQKPTNQNGVTPQKTALHIDRLKNVRQLSISHRCQVFWTLQRALSYLVNGCLEVTCLHSQEQAVQEIDPKYEGTRPFETSVTIRLHGLTPQNTSLTVSTAVSVTVFKHQNCHRTQSKEKKKRAKKPVPAGYRNANNPVYSHTNQ